MSQNETNANEIMRQWHEKMQSLLSNKELLEMARTNYQQFAKYIEMMQGEYDTANNKSDSNDNQHDAIKTKLNELENRIIMLERHIAKN